ncbi:MAG: bifunctional pyr operon transcriptional regulator/uracil phosphoribosyltransferase PyrR [Clostridia bacterium]|nr:bifunctional pyr operon transcriptional regulator/uracil phosphoribosyltransferase PyrR [Clostridia bacterium]
MKLKASLYDENALKRAIVRIAHEIVENNHSADKLCLVGIKTRGIPFAQRLSEAIEKIEGKKIPVGILDITMHRDDLGNKPAKISETKIDFNITGMDVVLTDDVIYTGRTVRAAMDALISYGRPAKIQLAVLCDRGHRELPIRPDYVGKNIPTSKSEMVSVSLKETDGTDSIELYE